MGEGIWIATALAAFVMADPVACTASPPTHTRVLPLHSIVGGHRLQPRERDLQTLGRPDVTSPQAAEIDRLYNQIIHWAEYVCKGGMTPPQETGNAGPDAASQNSDWPNNGGSASQYSHTNRSGKE